MVSLYLVLDFVCGGKHVQHFPDALFLAYKTAVKMQVKQCSVFDGYLYVVAALKVFRDVCQRLTVEDEIAASPLDGVSHLVVLHVDSAGFLLHHCALVRL